MLSSFVKKYRNILTILVFFISNNLEGSDLNFIIYFMKKIYTENKYVIFYLSRIEVPGRQEFDLLVVLYT